jgi:serine/threonine protein kinase/tetratricopeptide (TPR) repeat protein
MSPDPPTEYDQLTPQEAAQIDVVCDRFERAWKQAKAGGQLPLLASFVGQGQGPARAVLIGELIALDRVCRERYGFAVRPDDSRERETGVADPAIPATQRLRSGPDVPAVLPTGWPTIPGLELVEILGSGGMGVVFKARQVTLDRDVAVKFLRDPHLAESGERERFLQEARAVARLRHPHLVQLYEFGEAPIVGGAISQPYLVLEYVSGGSLSELVHSSPQSPREAARLVEAAADAIHYAHQQGVIHRDLKPANVLLQSVEDKGEERTEVVRGPRFSASRAPADGLIAKVTDFGLAKFLTGSDLTRTGEVLGTPSYMAPEQTGNSGPLTAAVDVYGLGAILYEALTGRPPFAGATVEETLCQVRQDEPVPPRRLQPTVPRDLETICLKCLRKEPGRRYATAQDLADDLRRFRAGEPIQARPVGSAERIVRWCRRKPVVAGLLAALVLVFLAGSAGVLWQWQRARRERDIAQQENERAERRLQMVRRRVDQLNQLGHKLLKQPGHYHTGKDVLEEALAFYKEMLPEDLNDPKVRREAAQLFDQVAWIHDTLGQADKEAEARGHEASLLTSLLKEDPADKDLRLKLADSHRRLGNALRGMGNVCEAREAYDQAADLHEGLLRESPGDAHYQVALANTLLNKAGMLSRRDQAEEWKPIFRRIVLLDRAAVDSAPNNPNFKAELALALQGQGLFCLQTGRRSEAEDALREALEIHKELVAGGHLKGYIESYAARNYIQVGRVLAAAGQMGDAENLYREAVSLLDRSLKDLPESVRHREELAQTLIGQADLLKDPARRQEVVEIRRRVIQQYETLRADSPKERKYRLALALHYLRLVSLLWELRQQTEAAELLRKSLELDPEYPAVNNELAWFLATTSELGLRDSGLAVRLAKKAVDSQRQSCDYWNTLGVAHYRNGDDKGAIAALETAMRLREGGDSFDWFFLAMAHWRLGDRDKAQTWFDRAVQWMDKHKPHDAQLRRFRAEADTMLAEVRKP